MRSSIEVILKVNKISSSPFTGCLDFNFPIHVVFESEMDHHVIVFRYSSTRSNCIYIHNIYIYMCMYIYFIETHLLKTIIMNHPVRRERILGSNWGFGSLYILIIAKDIFHVCLINPYGNLYYIDDLENIIEQLIA